MASLASEVGVRAVADLADFADACCDMQFGEITLEVPTRAAG